MKYLRKFSALKEAQETTTATNAEEKIKLSKTSVKPKYQEGDIILMHYWYGSIITPVLIKKVTTTGYVVTHDIEQSEMRGAPDEVLGFNEILGEYKETPKGGWKPFPKK